MPSRGQRFTPLSLFSQLPNVGNFRIEVARKNINAHGLPEFKDAANKTLALVLQSAFESVHTVRRMLNFGLTFRSIASQIALGCGTSGTALRCKSAEG